MEKLFQATKGDIIKIKNLKGMCRGQTIINAIESIRIMEGTEGLGKLKEKLKELNCWVDEYENFSKNIKAFEWYPLWYDVLPIVVAADIFNWDEERIKQFGIYNQKVSFFEKILLKYFVSLTIVGKTVSERWRKNYSVGELECVEVDEGKKRFVLRLRNFAVHPVFCGLLKGYFQSAGFFVVAPLKVKCEEVKCTFKGDKYHEFLLTWG
jgi:hypothetical protein